MLSRMDLVDAWRLVHDGSDHEPPRWTFGWEVQGDTRNPKRLVRVHLPQAMVENASGTYTMLTRADHKGVVVQLTPPAMLTSRPRRKFPTELLKATAVVAALRDRVQAVQGASDEEWWTETMSVLGEVGRQWRVSHSARGYSALEAAVCASNPQRVIQLGWDMLENQGYGPMTPLQAYQLLVTMLQDEKREGRWQQGIARLCQEFQTKAGKQEDRKSRRQRV